MSFAKQGLQRRVQSAPRVKHETRILPIGGRYFKAQILRERGHPLPNVDTFR